MGTLNNAETLALHWDGTQWTRFPTPNDGAYINVLTSASAVTSDDIWAVGYWATSGVDYHGYTLHWNGSAWNSVANPANPNQQSKPGDDSIPTGAYLYGVAATKKGEVWAVGRNLQNTGTTGVIFGLRSGKWSAMDNPNPGYANTKLYAVDASPGNAWAVGSFEVN